MCGRFTQYNHRWLMARLFNMSPFDEVDLEFEDRYNLAPTQKALLLRPGSPNIVTRMKWGLIPAWAAEPVMKYPTINAKAETVATLASFRDAFKKRRCLVPVCSYIEWQTIGKTKHPKVIKREDGEPIVFAGLWESWHSGKEDQVDSFTILTTAAQDALKHLHERMPVGLEPEYFNDWLDPAKVTVDTLPDLIAAQPSGIYSYFPVSDAINKSYVKNKDGSSTRIEGPQLIEPLGPEQK